MNGIPSPPLDSLPLKEGDMALTRMIPDTLAFLPLRAVRKGVEAARVGQRHPGAGQDGQQGEPALEGHLPIYRLPNKERMPLFRWGWGLGVRSCGRSAGFCAPSATHQKKQRASRNGIPDFAGTGAPSWAHAPLLHPNPYSRLRRSARPAGPAAGAWQKETDIVMNAQ